MKKFDSAVHCSSAVFALVSSAAITQQVHAQDDKAWALEEVVVTAQRRAEVLEDVPMSIAVVSAETLESSGATNLHDIGQIASGVQVDWAGAFTQPAIRGITSLTNGYGENNVAIYIDGFYEPSTISINQDLVNVDNIQVLKGPQGTLYGRNATGGAILINTLAPSETWTGLAEATYARFDDKRIKAYLSGPISEVLSFSIAGYYRESDGWLDFAPRSFAPATSPYAPSPNAMPREEHPAPLEQRSVRAKLQARFTENFAATLGYNYGYSNVLNGNLYTTYDHRPATLPATTVPFPPAPEFGQVAYNYDTVLLAKTDQATLKVAWDTAIGTLTSYSSYGRIVNPLEFDFDGTYADITSSTSEFNQYTKQQTLDLAINAIERLDLVVGAFYINDDVHANPDELSINYGPGRTPATATQQGLEAESWAVYLDGTFRITDSLSLSAGARYTDERKKGYYEQHNALTNAVIFPATTKYLAFNKLTPRASVRYELAPQMNVYASYSKGFRSGTLSLSGAAAPALWLPVEPETVDSYEIGFKAAMGIVRFDIAGFYNDYKDIHVSVLRPDPRCPSPVGCTVLTVFQNAEGAEIYGVDGSVTISPTDDFNIRLGAAWLHARYTDFGNASGTALNPATNLNVGGTIQDWTDKEMARAPEFAANLGIDYKLRLPFGGLLLATNISYSDSYVINNPSLLGGRNATTGVVYPGTEQRFRQDSLTLLNASVTWTDPNEHFSVGVFGNNLSDEEHRVAYSGANFGDYGSLAEPRTYGMRLGYRF